MEKSIIELALCNYYAITFKKNNVTFIITKNKDIYSSFTSSIKTISLTLWMISNRSKIDLLSVEHTYKVKSDIQDLKTKNELYSSLLSNIFKIIENGELKRILDNNGTSE